MTSSVPWTAKEAFEAFVESDGARLRRVLVAQHGVDLGNDLCADALAKAWTDWDRVRAMENPTGYLYRVAQSASRRYRRWRTQLMFPVEVHDAAAPGSGDIFLSLGRLSDLQRICVVMVHAHGWTYPEVAEVLGIATTAVTNHVTRGMAKLRNDLGEEDA
jgi:DNA-directed RNA polymerase specialized sigma24 family protein